MKEILSSDKMVEMQSSNWPQVLFRTILIIGFLVLFARLIDVSLIRGPYYQSLVRQNRIRAIPLQAPRGNIFDRNGVVLATNEETTRILKFEAGKPPRYTEAIQVTEPLKEVGVAYWKRKYPQGEATAHIVGYLGEATEEEVGKVGCPGNTYSLADLVGRVGAEEAFDCMLRGKNGEELVEVDTKGNKVRVLGRREPKSGQDIKLSIDAMLQQAAFNALAGQKGAVVALDPKNGEVLALISSPAFNPETISGDFPQLATNPLLPLLNRAIGGAYPPGSTFKIVTAASGLEEGKIDEGTRFVDPGVITVGPFRYANWYFTQYGKLEGEIDLVRAIKRSTDTFFYKVGEWVGVRQLADWGKKFGLGEKTGIEISGETAGLVPTPEWKERNRGERWFLGNTYHLSIGQADLAATPLQVTVMTNVIASGGKLCKPTVRKSEIRNLPAGKAGPKSETCYGVGLSQKTIELITQGMTGACSPGGTAFPLFNFAVKSLREPASAPAKPVQVACKTGTAEFGDPKGRTHAWLTAFGPAQNPEIAVTALVEAGGEGSRVAAPVVKEVLEEWFGK